jgi:hypothetical protein
VTLKQRQLFERRIKASLRIEHQRTLPFFSPPFLRRPRFCADKVRWVTRSMPKGDGSIAGVQSMATHREASS